MNLQKVISAPSILRKSLPLLVLGHLQVGFSPAVAAKLQYRSLGWQMILPQAIAAKASMAASLALPAHLNLQVFFTLTKHVSS